LNYRGGHGTNPFVTQPSNQGTWNQVDDYFAQQLVGEDPVAEQLLEACINAGLPAHHVSPLQGKLLMLFVKMQHARRILEIGTLGGYSTMWLARGLPDGGKIVTLERNPDYATIAHHNWQQAGVAGMIELRVGLALESLQALVQERCEPFDVIFIDADKPNNPRYLPWCLQLSRTGTLLLADNVVRDGKVVDAGSSDPNVQGIRTFVELVAREPRLEATAMQSVGCKGYDGMLIARVVG
jgi:predicted O-methyltransferase YrrM